MKLASAFFLMCVLLSSAAVLGKETKTTGFVTTVEGSLAETLFEIGDRGANETTETKVVGLGLGEIVWETSSRNEAEKSFKCWRKLSQSTSGSAADGLAASGGESSWTRCNVKVFFSK